MSTSEILSQDEVTALKNQNFTFEAPGPVRSYDFTKQEIKPFANQTNLETITDIFLEQCAMNLSRLLRHQVSIVKSKTEVLIYDELIKTTHLPAIFNLLSISPVNKPALLILDYPLIFNIVNILFGGQTVAVDTINRRRSSYLELRLAKTISDEIIGALNAGWGEVTDLSFKSDELETNLNLVALCSQVEPVLVEHYQVIIDQITMNFCLCLPRLTIDPIRARLDSEQQGIQKKLQDDHVWAQDLKANVLKATMAIRARLPQELTSLNELLHLKVGDVLTISEPKEVMVYIEDLAIFKAKCGIHNGKHAIELIDYTDEE